MSAFQLHPEFYMGDNESLIYIDCGKVKSVEARITHGGPSQQEQDSEGSDSSNRQPVNWSLDQTIEYVRGPLDGRYWYARVANVTLTDLSAATQLTIGKLD